MSEVQISHLTCKRCGHRWAPRKADVRTCPRCKSPYWDKERNVISKPNLPEMRQESGDKDTP